MASRGFLSPRRSNPTRTAPTHLTGSVSAPEPIIQSATLTPSPSPNRRGTKSASQPSSSNKKGKAATGSRSKPSVATKDGSSHHKFSDSSNHSPSHFPSPVNSSDHLLRNPLQQLSLHGIDDDVTNNVHQSRSVHKSASSDSIEQYNSQSNAPTMLFKIYEVIASHRQGNTSIKSYIKKLKALWDEPAPTHTNSPQSSSNVILEKSELMEREKLMQFLLGLNDSYSSLCSEILLVRPSPTVDQACSLIIQEEKTRKSKMSKKITK